MWKIFYNIMEVSPKTAAKKIAVCVFCIILYLSCSLKALGAQGKWSITAYGAVLTRAPIEEALFNASEIDESFKFIALAIGRQIVCYKNIDLELEGQVVKHFENQNHMEFNALFIVRWLKFPWNNYINTSFAIGDGLSMATKIPKLERELHDDRSGVSQLLNYLLLELSFSLPNTPQWNLIGRLHHRSGVAGIFNGANGGSNGLGLGIKYKF
jgi:hypothetical protein